ncbi:MAG: hypothetical protein OES46_21985 [Gammaproteobacteria bacterium]|nr:hypothetical protein [Gammaproteobacteria bacterium]
MGKVIKFPAPTEKYWKEIDALIETKVHHRNPKVAQCIRSHLKRLLRKYSKLPARQLRFTAPADCDKENIDILAREIKGAVTEYVRERQLDMLAEIAKLQKKVCEYEYSKE